MVARKAATAIGENGRSIEQAHDVWHSTIRGAPAAAGGAIGPRGIAVLSCGA